MAGMEPGPSGVESNRSANCSTTAAQSFYLSYAYVGLSEGFAVMKINLNRLKNGPNEKWS